MQMFTCAAFCIAAVPQDTSSQVCSHLLPIVAPRVKHKEADFKRVCNVLVFFFVVLTNNYIRINLEQRGAVLVRL